jgi:S1-C subfamily serine protease
VTLKTYPFKGVTVAMLTPQMAEELQLKLQEPRVVVLDGGEGMGGIGVQTGDIIIAVNQKEIHSIADLEHALSAHSPR